MIDYNTLKTMLSRGNTSPESYVTKTYGFTVKGSTILHNNEVLLKKDCGYPTLQLDVVFSHRLNYDDLYKALSEHFSSVVVAGCDEDFVNVGYDCKTGKFVIGSNSIILSNGQPLAVPEVYADLTISQLEADLVDEITQDSPNSAIAIKRCKCCGRPYIVDYSYASYIWRKGWALPMNCTACRVHKRTNRKDQRQW